MPHSQAKHPYNRRSQVTPETRCFNFEMGHNERGVVLSNPLTIRGNTVYMKSGDLDPVELRRALLFWDKIVWPSTNGIHIPGGGDANFLEQQNKLIRPLFRVNGDGATTLSMAFSETYRILADRHPGKWILSEGQKSLQVHGQNVENGRGLVAQLFNSVPIPDRTMPLEDIIKFREKRTDEVVALRMCIDGFYQQWINSEDKDHQRMLATSKIDTASADMVRVARESKLPFAMSSWKINFGASPDVIKALAGYLGAAQAMDLSTVGSLLVGAATSTLSVGTDIGLRNSDDSSPFNYVASMEKSLF